MQNGSVIRRHRKRHSDIWQFRWWKKTSDGKKVYRRRQIGTVDQIPDIDTARKAASLLVPDLNARMAKSKPVSMTIAQLCNHFEQSELCFTNTWRSYSTKNIYKVYLKRWIIPKWSEHFLSDIRTIIVASKPSHREEHMRRRTAKPCSERCKRGSGEAIVPQPTPSARSDLKEKNLNQ